MVGRTSKKKRKDAGTRERERERERESKVIFSYSKPAKFSGLPAAAAWNQKLVPF